ncbi:MAG: ABC transporter permease [Gemmatimonadales bacterium]|nr:ABC transporter permease [Gemmatimonadales bacterium]
MHKVWAVIRREFVERVRTRTFLLSTLLFPALMVGITVLPVLLDRRVQAPKRIAVLDGASGEAGARVTDGLAAAKRAGGTGAARYVVTRVVAGADVDRQRDSLVRQVGVRGEAEGLDGVLVISDDAVTTGKIPYYGANVGSPQDMRRLETEVQTALRLERLRRAGIDPFVAMPALRPIDLQAQKVSGGTVTGESGDASFILAYAMSFLLYMALLLYGNQVMTSVVEEKASRISEVLMGSMRPFQLLLGKVLGVGAVGLVQLGVWAGTAMALTRFRAQLAGLFGVAPDSLRTMPIPEVSPGLLAVFLLFFVLGFLFYASLYAAVGSTCSTVQETQQASVPVTMTIAVGLILMFSLFGEPNGSLARTLSMLPPFAPFMTPVRHALVRLSPVEIGLSALAVAAGVVAVAWLAGQIYRTGILMHGRRASLREVWRWLRAG